MKKRSDAKSLVMQPMFRPRAVRDCIKYSLRVNPGKNDQLSSDFGDSSMRSVPSV